MLLSAQGRGIGTALLESCQEPLSPLQPVDIQAQRQRFYERHGCSANQEMQPDALYELSSDR